MSMCVKLQCGECENIDCPIARRYIPEDSQEGCVRKIEDDLYVEYIHYLEEVAPFMYSNTTKEYQCRIYQEIIEVLAKAYDSPAVQKTNPRGKVIPSWKKKRQTTPLSL